CLNEGDYW
nr:immunoglobulin heavy chain junction region [Macaca mulatta]MPN76008.1 immunoglobulin heavy chain junction region [Macaca mulatta]MPN77823.1 immunoglobulin heavy chain junction region [Macaca mulatta]